MVSTENRKLIENEAKFREYNESVEKGFDDLKQTAIAQGWASEIIEPTGEFYFYCECSDENCENRLKLTIVNYSQIHENRDRFIVECGHEVPAVERVIEHGQAYCIVEKRVSPPEYVDHLHETDIENV